MIYNSIAKLVSYGVAAGLINPEDKVYVTNRLLALLKLDSMECTDLCTSGKEELAVILRDITDYAVKEGIIEDSIVFRDIFDTEIMDILTPYPSQVIDRFNRFYSSSPKEATDYFYKLSCDTNYIRKDRIEKDIKWIYPSEYGDLEITINRSKPEKDPKAIAAAKNAPNSAYPLCQLCVENEGYAGRANHPARANHRIIPLEFGGSEWGLQYSPYVYYNEHCIVLNKKHIPMVIDRGVFSKLLDFVDKFNHYMIGSNADLPIVGGSILSHEHFQGGGHVFPMHKAPGEEFYTIKGFENVTVSTLKWPMSVIRLESGDKNSIVELSDRILTSWRTYTDEDAFIFACTDGENHNTITPIASMRDGKYVMDLVLRNNITTPEHPLGVYHPHSELHHIKKENIGLIEVMGLAVLPARLATELTYVEKGLVQGLDLSACDNTAHHQFWAEEVLQNHPELDSTNAGDILRMEVGKVFVKVLEHAGVFKRDVAGREAFARFIKQI